MSTATALTILIGFATIFMVVGWIATRQARRAWRRYSVSATRPLISNISVDQIDDLPEEWPLPENRWPIPRVPEIAADPVVAAAYARLARRSEQGLLYAAELLAIVGGAWLGTNLLAMWGRLTVVHGEVVLALERGDSLELSLLPLLIFRDVDLWLSALPVIPIVGGIALRARANRYTDARAIYQLAASSVVEDDPSPQPVPAVADAPGGLVTLLRRLIS